MSAISLYHEKVDSKPTGQHPPVSALMTETFNTNPPSAKHFHLKCLDCMKTNDKLSDRFHILKLTALLSLTSESRGHEIAYVDVRYMIKKENPIMFYFSKITKSWKQGKSPSKIEFCVFPKDQKLCAVACLKEYLKRFQGSRVSDSFKAS